MSKVLLEGEQKAGAEFSAEFQELSDAVNVYAMIYSQCSRLELSCGDKSISVRVEDKGDRVNLFLDDYGYHDGSAFAPF
ncbi:hypothetical protein AB4254_09320 [Vibrio breoganii]